MTPTPQNGIGWGFFAELDKSAEKKDEKHNDERARVAALMLQAFTSDAGVEVMAILERDVLNRPSMPDIGAELMLLDPGQFTMYCAWNEAQKALVRKIKKLIDEGKRPPQQEA